MNFRTVFLGIIAVMLTTLVIIIGIGFILARNMLSLPLEGKFVNEVTEVEDTVFIIEE